MEEEEGGAGRMEGIGIVVTDEDKVTGAKYSLRCALRWLLIIIIFMCASSYVMMVVPFGGLPDPLPTQTQPKQPTTTNRNPDEVAAFLSRVVQLRGDDFAGGNKAFFAEGRFNAQITLEDITASSPSPPPPPSSGGAAVAGGGGDGPVTPSTPPPLGVGEEGEGGAKK